MVLEKKQHICLKSFQYSDDNVQPLPFARSRPRIREHNISSSNGFLWVFSNLKFSDPKLLSSIQFPHQAQNLSGKHRQSGKESQQTKSIQRCPRPQHKQPEFVAVDRFSLESYATHVVQRQNKAYKESMMNQPWFLPTGQHVQFS